MLTIAKGEGNNLVVKIKNNNEAGNPQTGLNYLWVNAAGATNNNATYGSHDAENAEEISVVVEFDEPKDSYDFVNIHWAYAGWTGEWAIDGLTVTVAAAVPDICPYFKSTVINKFCCCLRRAFINSCSHCGRFGRCLRGDGQPFS